MVTTVWQDDPASVHAGSPKNPALVIDASSSSCSSNRSVAVLSAPDTFSSVWYVLWQNSNTHMPPSELCAATWTRMDTEMAPLIASAGMAT